MADGVKEPHNVPQDALLACQAVAVCLELFRTCPVMGGGGNFKVADIAGNINALAWGRQASYIVDPHLLGHGLEMLLPDHLGGWGWSPVAGRRDRDAASIILGTNEFGHRFGFRVEIAAVLAKRQRTISSSALAADVGDVRTDEERAVAIATTAGNLLTALGYRQSHTVATDVDFWARYNATVVRKDGGNIQCNLDANAMLAGIAAAAAARR